MVFLCHVADWYWRDRCSYRAHDLDHVWTVVQEQKVCVTIYIVFVFLSYISGCRGNPGKFRQQSQFFRVNFSPPVACFTHPAHAYMPCRWFEVKSAIVLNVALLISVLIIVYNLHRLTYKYHRLVQNNSDKPGELPAVERCVVDEDEEDEEEVMLFMAILLMQGQNWSTSLNLPLVLCRIFHQAHFRFICACLNFYFFCQS